MGARDTADLRKDIRFVLEWHLYAILSEGKHNKRIHIRSKIKLPWVLGFGLVMG